MVDINLDRALNSNINNISNAESNEKIKQIVLGKLDGIYLVANKNNNNYLSKEINIIKKELGNKHIVSDDDLQFVVQRLHILNKHIKNGMMEFENEQGIPETLLNMEKDINQKIN